MALQELSFLGLALLAVFAGGWSICLTRTSNCQYRVLWGKRLYLLTILLLGLVTMVAAALRIYALTPLGLSLGLLVVAAVWEPPRQQAPVREM